MRSLACFVSRLGGLAALALCALLVPVSAEAQTGAVSGTVRSGTTPLAARVLIYTSSGNLTGSATANASGDYIVSGLAAGTYRAFADASQLAGGYTDVLYPDIHCFGAPATSGTLCPLSDGDPITVNSGAVTADIDFDLAIGGGATGTITAGGVAYPGTRVELHVNAGLSTTRVISSATTGPSGVFEFRRLPAGDYYVWAGNVTGGALPGYVSELYDNVPCDKASSSGIPISGAGCSIAAATAVAVELGEASPAVNVDLVPGGGISGTLTGDLSLPLSGGTINLYSSGSSYLQFLATGATGGYLFRGLPPGQYRLVASIPGHTSEVYDGIPCPPAGCDVGAGTLVTVTAGSVRTDTDFALGPQAAPYIVTQPTGTVVLSGQTVTLSVQANGQAPLSYQWYRGACCSTSDPVAGATSPQYTTPPVTAAASYWVQIANPVGLASSSAATVSPLGAGAGGISGTVTSGATSVANAQVIFYNASSQQAGSTYTSASGAYSMGGLAVGSYRAYVYAGNVTGNYVDQLYPNIPCSIGPNTSGSYCLLSTGGTISVTANNITSGINFNLLAGATIDGVVSGGGVTSPGAPANLYVADGSSQVRSILGMPTDGLGRYRFTRLAPGDYWVRAAPGPTGAAAGYVPEIFDNVPCPGFPSIGIIPSSSAPCSTAGATPIAVSVGSSEVASFDLEPAGAISGRVTGPTGQPPQFAATAVYSLGGVQLASSSTGIDGSYLMTGLPGGSYRITTTASGLVGEVYDNIPCPPAGCATVLGSGTPIAVTAGATTGINVQLADLTPAIVTQPLSQFIRVGLTALLRVDATGELPLGYQWYRGASGDTTTPIPGAIEASYTTPALSADVSYWVRVSNTRGQVDSSTAVMTVGTPPSITEQPASPILVTGTTATLSITAAGTGPLSVQWYTGTTGTTTAPIAGATSTTYTTPALTIAANYWVRVSSPFGMADSATAAVTIGVAPTIATHPVDQRVNVGTSATLSVSVNGTAPISYQWYEGPAGTIGTPVAGATNSTFVSPPVNAVKSYWVRASSPYGTADSEDATVTPIPVVGLPTDLYIKSITGNLVTFVWTGGEGQLPVTGHLIEGGILGQTAVLAQLPTGSAATTFTLAAPNGAFFVRVKALAGATAGAASDEISLCLNVPCPAITPENLLGLVNGADLALAWRNPLESGVPTKVTLHVSGAVNAALDLPGTAEQFTYSGVPPGTYDFRLEACTASGCSAPTAPVALTFPTSCSGVPGAPAGFMASKSGSTITVDWELPEGGQAATSFMLHVTGSFVGSLPATGKRLSGTVGAGSYTISVSAVNACGTGPATTPVTVVIP